MKRVGAVILAAGASTRLREPKQLVAFGHETLLERSVRVASEAACSPVVVVLGAFAELIRTRCNLDESLIVVNERWSEGMGASVKLGIDALSDADGVILMTCDMPAVTAEHLSTLMTTGEVTASYYARRRGVPAYFPASAFPVLIKLEGDVGAKELLHSARAVELPNGELDIDTIEDIEAARQLFGSLDFL